MEIPKFEYKRVNLGYIMDPNMNIVLNNLGLDGWELVSTIKNHNNMIYGFMKRPLTKDKTIDGESTTETKNTRITEASMQEKGFTFEREYSVHSYKKNFICIKFGWSNLPVIYVTMKDETKLFVAGVEHWEDVSKYLVDYLQKNKNKKNYTIFEKYLDEWPRLAEELRIPIK